MLSDFNWAFWPVSNHLNHLLLNHNFICYHSYFKLSSYFMFRSFTQHFPNHYIILLLSYQEYQDYLTAVSSAFPLAVPVFWIYHLFLHTWHTSEERVPISLAKSLWVCSISPPHVSSHWLAISSLCFLLLFGSKNSYILGTIYDY